MEVLRYTAFTDTPDGGNPAGVVLDGRGATDAEMLRVAADVGYSETAFLQPTASAGTLDVRYFSPQAEVPFCGHATIAAAVAHGHVNGFGALTMNTRSGPVQVTSTLVDGTARATLRSVPPRSAGLAEPTVAALLDALRIKPGSLEHTLPIRAAFAGAWHPIVAVADPVALRELDYDFDALNGLMAEHDWTTVAVVHRVSPTEFEARNPFPPGGVVEDPATGAAAAALGGYLRQLDAITTPANLVIRQGQYMGRPSRLDLHVPTDGGVAVGGQVVRIS